MGKTKTTKAAKAKVTKAKKKGVSIAVGREKGKESLRHA